MLNFLIPFSRQVNPKSQLLPLVGKYAGMAGMREGLHEARSAKHVDRFSLTVERVGGSQNSKGKVHSPASEVQLKPACRQAGPITHHLTLLPPDY